MLCVEMVTWFLQVFHGRSGTRGMVLNLAPSDAAPPADILLFISRE